MSRPSFALIDTQAFTANYRYAKSLAPAARAVAVIKANAYGHGAVALARVLAAEADAFAVASTEEAMELRESGITNSILLLEGAFEPAEIDNAAVHGFALVIHTSQQLEWLRAARPKQALNVWLKADTGMHRLGFAPHEVQQVHARLSASPNVDQIVLMSHFARADETGEPATDHQLALFQQMCQGLPGAVLSLIHI